MKFITLLVLLSFVFAEHFKTEVLEQVINERSKLSKYKIVKKLSSGAQGAVYSGIRMRKDGSHPGRVIVKANKVDPNLVQNQVKEGDVIKMMELAHERALSHMPKMFIERLAVWTQPDGGEILVTEMGLTVADLIKNKIWGKLNKACIYKNLAESLQQIHQTGKVHLDLKPDNVLFTNQGRAIFIDYGITQDPGYLNQGTFYTTAPEVFENIFNTQNNFKGHGKKMKHGNYVDQKADLFSLAHTVYFLEHLGQIQKLNEIFFNDQGKIIEFYTRIEKKVLAWTEPKKSYHVGVCFQKSVETRAKDRGTLQEIISCLHRHLKTDCSNTRKNITKHFSKIAEEKLISETEADGYALVNGPGIRNASMLVKSSFDSQVSNHSFFKSNAPKHKNHANSNDFQLGFESMEEENPLDVEDEVDPMMFESMAGNSHASKIQKSKIIKQNKRSSHMNHGNQNKFAPFGQMDESINWGLPKSNNLRKTNPFLK